MKTTLNKDITLTGALSAGSTSDNTVQIPPNMKVVGVEFTEIANADTKNYDLRMDDDSGIRMDYQHRLSVCAVIAGSTIMNGKFKDRQHEYEFEGSQKVIVKTRLIDALAGGQSISVRATFHLENCSK